MQDKKFFKLLILLSLLAISLIAFYIFFDLSSEYVFNLRLKKIIAIILVCYATAYSTVSFQAITNNNILTPSIMGLESLYIFLQTFTMYVLGIRALQKMSSLQEFTFSLIIMLLFSILIYVVLFEKLAAKTNIVILCGMIFGTLFHSLSTFMQVLLDPNEFLVLQGKIFASFNSVNFSYLNISSSLILLIIIYSIFYTKKLDVISLGKKNAISLGLNYNIEVKIIFSFISILVSISTVLVGPMTFLGIIVISITKKLIPSYKTIYQTITSFLVGVILVIVSMLLMEKLLDYDSAISIVINFIGGIYFIYLVIKESIKQC